MYNKYSLKKGSIMVVVLTLVLTFATIAIAMNELVVSQSLELEYTIAKTQAEYAALAGLVHGKASLNEDINTNFTLNPEILKTFYKTWCVEWFTANGIRVCNLNPNANDYCCASTLGQCRIRPVNGLCKSENNWILSYKSRYDSIEKAIISSASIEFIIEDEKNNSLREPVRFDVAKQMGLNWE